MKNPSANACLWSGVLLATLIAPISVGAEGDDTSVLTRERPELDPLGIHSGAFIVYPSIGVSITQDDNIFATDNNTESDQIVQVSPGVEVVSDWNNHALEMALSADIGRYSDNSDESYNDYSLRADGRTDITRQERLYSRLRYERLHEGRDSVNDAGGSKPTEYTRTDLSLTYNRRFNRVELDVGGRIDMRDYSDGSLNGFTINNDDRDRTETTVFTRAQYQFNSGYKGFAELSINQRNYDAATDDNGFDRSSSGSEWRIGAKAALTGISTASGYIGYVSQDPDDSAFSTVSGTSYGGELIWNATTLTSVTATVERTTEETTLASAGALRTRYGVRVDHELLRNLLLFAAYDRYADDYNDLDRDDSETNFIIGAQYLMNRQLYWFAELRTDSRDSSGDDAGEDYDRQQVFLGAEFNL
ncbi:MAG: outer membrane beta-barrel protein [Pseudomonadota bacterium]